MAAIDMVAITDTTAAMTIHDYTVAVPEGARVVVVNRARKIADGTYTVWRSFDEQDLTMSSHPGGLNPVNYTDFTILPGYTEG